MKIVRRITRFLAIAMPLLTFAFLCTNIDGQKMEFVLHLNAKQAQELARMIDYNLARGESFENSWYGYHTYAQHEDYLQLNVGEGFYFEGSADAPVLALAKKLVAQSSVGASFVFSLAYAVPLGWLAELSLIITLIILCRKSKKQNNPAGDGLPGVPAS